jgi:hypothetical protein
MEFALASGGTRADVEACAAVAWSCDAEAMKYAAVPPGPVRFVESAEDVLFDDDLEAVATPLDAARARDNVGEMWAQGGQDSPR